MARLPLKRATDANDDPVSGGSILFYDAGTTTPRTVYSDVGLSTSLGTSVTTNAEGWAANGGSMLQGVYAEQGVYKIRYQDADAAELFTEDNVRTVPEGPFYYASRTDAEAADTGSETYIVVAGLSYVYDASGTALTTGDGRKWSPHGVSYPEHFGALGDGAEDDTDAIIAWAAHGGAMQGTVGATYLCSTLVIGDSVITLAAGAKVDGKGAQIRFSETDDTNAHRVNFSANARVDSVHFYWTGTNYFRRAMQVQAGVELINCTWEAQQDQPDFTTNTRDGCVRIMGGDVTMRGSHFINIFDCIRGDSDADPILPNVHILETTLEAYGSGISTQGVFDNGVIKGGRALSINANAGPDAGRNTISNASPGLKVTDWEIWDSPEHAIYLATTDPIYGVTVGNCRVRSSGQCGLKLRGLWDFTVYDYRSANQHNATAPGTNEDGFRLEECHNGTISDIQSVDENGEGSAGYDCIHIDSCSNLQFIDATILANLRAGIYISDTRDEGSVDRIVFNGLTVVTPETSGTDDNPILEIVAAGNIGDVECVNVFAQGLKGDVIKIDAAGTVGRILMEGDIETSGTYINNVQGGSGAIIQGRTQLVVGSDSREDRLPAFGVTRRFSSSAGFDPLDSNSTASLILGCIEPSTGQGDYHGALLFTKPDSGRPGGAIVAYQFGADTDLIGLSFWCNDMVSPTDEMTLYMEIALNGSLNLTKTGGGYQIGGTQVVGAQEAAISDPALDLAEVRTALIALLGAARSHGLIAT